MSVSSSSDDGSGESFRGLLLQLRGRTGLEQREPATLLGVHAHSLQTWEARRGALQHTRRGDRRYERLNVAGLTGITQAQCGAMLGRGAVDHEYAGVVRPQRGA